MKSKVKLCFLLVLIISLISCGAEQNQNVNHSESAGINRFLTSDPSRFSPLDSSEYNGMDYLEVETLFQKAGFETIVLSNIDDIDSGSVIKDGTVELVQIKKTDNYTSDTVFDKNDEVVIVYHNIPKLTAPMTSTEALSKNYMEVGKTFFEAGFINVETDEIYDHPSTSSGNTVLKAGGQTIETKKDLAFDNAISVIEHFPVSKYPVTISIDFISNWIFSKYDVNVTLNGEKLGTLSHGEDGTYNISLQKGNYDLVFTKKDDSSISGTTKLSVNSQTQATYQISCNSEKINVENKAFDQALKKGKIMMPYNYWHYLRKDVQQVADELKELGFKNVKTQATKEFFWAPDKINSVVKVEVGKNTEFKHDNIFDANTNIIVFFHTADFSFNQESIDVTEKDTFELPYTLSPGDLVDSIEFDIDHPEVLQRNNDGTYTALIPGTATVTAYSGGDKYAKCIVNVEEIIVPIDKVVFSSSDIDVSVGSVFKLDYTIVPEEANYINIMAEVSNEFIEVGDDLMFYSDGEGDSEISFYQDGRLLGSCTVHAKLYEIEDLIMEDEPNDVYIGDTINLKYTLLPEEATNKGITVTSSDTQIADIEFDERGPTEVKIIGKSAGEADIKIILPNGNEYTKTITVNEIMPEKIVVNHKNADRRIEVGTPIEIEVKWEPDNTSVKEVSWSSSDDRIISVNDKGYFEAVGVGTAEITATHKSGISETISITVEPTLVTKVEAVSDWDSTKKLYAGNSFKISAQVFPENATNQNLIYSSEDESIAKVSEAGSVTAVGPGSTNIKVSSPDGPNKSIPVTVTPTPQKFKITWSASCNNYNHVGSNWSKTFLINDEPFSSGSTIILNPEDSINVKFYVEESDSDPDVGYFWQDIPYSNELCTNGYTIAMDVPATENRGRYSGYSALWNLKVNITPIH